MSFLRTLAGSAALGAAGGGLLTLLNANKLAEVEEWAEGIAANDREHLYNHQPLPPIEEPQPARDFSHTKPTRTWWTIGLAIWAVPAALGGLLFAFVSAGSGEAGANAFGLFITGFIFGFMVSSVLFLPAGVIVAVIMRGRITLKNQNNKASREAVEAARAVWEVREQARQKMAQGLIPVTYLEMIGVNPDTMR